MRISGKNKEKIKNFLRDFVYYSWYFLSPFKKKIDPEKIRRVLVIHPRVVGDLMLITPTVKALAKKYGKVDVLIKPDMEQVLSGNPNVKKLIKHYGFEETLKKIKNKYDLAIIVAPLTFEMKKLCIKANIKYMIGNEFSYSFSDFLLSARVKNNNSRNSVAKYLELARLAGADLENPKLEIYFSKDDEKYVENMLKKNKIKEFVVIHAGKRGNNLKYFWPTSDFAKVADHVVEKYKVSVILTGSPIERKINDEIMRKVKSRKVFNFCEKTNIKQLACLLKKTRLLICLNTGVVPIACAFKRKMIAINEEFPALWHPWTDKKDYIMLTDPGIGDVEESIKKLF